MTPLILSALLLLANVSATSQANGSATPPNAFATYQANEGAGLQRSEAPQSNATPRSGQPAVHSAAGLSGAPLPDERAGRNSGAVAAGRSSGAPLTGTATWYDAPSRTDDAPVTPAQLLRYLWETALIERLRIVGNDGKVAVHVCDLFGPDDPLTTDITASLEEER